MILGHRKDFCKVNEEQRKAGTIDILNERNKKQKKTIVNISNMFINHLILKKQKAW